MVKRLNLFCASILVQVRESGDHYLLQFWGKMERNRHEQDTFQKKDYHKINQLSERIVGRDTRLERGVAVHYQYKPSATGSLGQFLQYAPNARI
jgi:hypothetical protein